MSSETERPATDLTLMSGCAPPRDSMIATGELLALVSALAHRRAARAGTSGSTPESEFTVERRRAIESAQPRGGYDPPADARTPEALALHVERIACAFLGWPGNECSDAELVYGVALYALRRMRQLCGQHPDGQADHRELIERAAVAEARLQAFREQVARGDLPGYDRCQFCLGVKGGEPGKEKPIGGALACAECRELVQAAIDNAAPQPAAPIADDAAADLGRAIQDATARAAEIAGQEARGERVALVTPLGGTVTDPDELEMHRQLKAQNLSRCTRCQNTGWLVEGSIFCECPYGEFLAKKIRAHEAIPGEHREEV